MRFFRSILLVVLFTTTSAADDSDPSSAVDYPRVTFNHRGPAGRVEAMVFAGSPTRLFVAGEDKVVDVYFVDGKPGKRPVATHATTMRWERGRDQLGRIYAMALAEPTQSLAIAGYSLRNAAGDIALFDTTYGRTTGVLPYEDRFDSGRTDAERNRTNGHIAAIVSLDYSRSGNRLISVDAYGEMRVWDSSKDSVGPVSQSKVLRAAKTSRYVGARFRALLLSDRYVVATEPADWKKDRSDWTLQLFDLQKVDQPGSGKTELTSQPGRISSLSRDSTGRLIAVSFEPTGTSTGRVLVWNNGARKGPLPDVSDLQFIRTTFGPDGLLVVTGYRPQQRDNVLRIFDCNRYRKLAEVPISDEFDTARVLAVSPDGRFLARDSFRNQSVEIYQLDREASGQGTPALSASDRIRSRGLRIGSARFSNDDKYRIAFNTIDQKTKDPGQARRYFDLREMRPRVRDSRIRRTKWRDKTGFVNGWSINDRAFPQVPVTNGAATRWTINLSVAQGPLTAWHRIQSPDNDELVVLGTRDSKGVYVYRLPPAGGTAELVRYFRGHSGSVSCLNVSPDVRYLVSGSLDNTIRLWSLEGIAGAEAGSIAESRLGVRFSAPSSDGITVTDVDPNGIAAARGVTAGAIVLEVQYQQESASKSVVAVSDAGRIVDAFLASPPEKLLRFELSNNPRESLWFTPGWEPLATLFFTDNDDWVCATPSGYYAASSGDGHELIVWQQNQGRTRPIRLARGAELRATFHQPDVLKQLFDQGSLPEALRDSGLPAMDSVVQTGTLLTEEFGRDPDIQLLEPGSGTIVDGTGQAVIRARVRLPSGSTPDGYVAHAYVNGRSLNPTQLQTADRAPDGSFDVEWRDQPTAPVNRVRVVLKPDDDSKPYKFAETGFTSTARARPMRIHSLIAGANNYSGDLESLMFAAQDATSVAAAIRAFDGAQDGMHILLSQEGVTRAAMVEKIGELGREVQRLHQANAGVDQLLVVFLAGHGKETGGTYYFLPPDVESAANIPKKGVSWDEFESLASLPCRKLFIIDTCNSGAVAGETDAVQSLSDSQVVVIAASAADQAAREINAFERGALTHCVLTGQSGLADGFGESASRDGVITLRELAEYVRRQLPEVTDEYLGTTQIPTVAPNDLLSIQSVPLVRQ